jgi:2-keto-4-pentenoate hydratase/2-oxohepta-3-ene-1,7-dioic acid hydratase in catechol pathway
MKLLAFRAGGVSSYGIVEGEGVIDVGRRLGDRWSDLTALLADPAGVHTLAGLAKDISPDHRLAELEIDLPVSDTAAIFCVGKNYHGHALLDPKELPTNPSIFLRMKRSFVPAGKPVLRPRLSTNFDYEGELALIVGKGGRHIDEGDALSHIAGYTCLNEGSVRDFQLNHSVTSGKNFGSSGSIGPWIVTADEIGDPARLHVTTRVNGEERQASGLDRLIFSIPRVIAYISGFTELRPGDVIATGTPPGAGFTLTPKRWLEPGDSVEIDIPGVGVLRNPVAAESGHGT